MSCQVSVNQPKVASLSNRGTSRAGGIEMIRRTQHPSIVPLCDVGTCMLYNTAPDRDGFKRAKLSL